ncbi:hypothetical protein O181_074060 [Austropuccinia psidii MF-1]|uniref:Uncharacterized protein n=1 Tax=Austropuccinia psidii MF-1 TaxID=1389203 RepID=A0A9Q3F3T5_9BASI|nr:hypothetical protein [Austropuccinia psidii MF-1]
MLPLHKTLCPTNARLKSGESQEPSESGYNVKEDTTVGKKVILHNRHLILMLQLPIQLLPLILIQFLIFKSQLLQLSYKNLFHLKISIQVMAQPETKPINGFNPTESNLEKKYSSTPTLSPSPSLFTHLGQPQNPPVSQMSSRAVTP